MRPANMGYDTIFYIFGGLLAAIAVTTSFVGLRSEKFPGRATPVMILAFVALVGVTTTYSVLNGQEEEEHRAHELEQANVEIEEEEEDSVSEGTGEQNTGEADSEVAQGDAESGGEKAPVNGPGGTLQLAASETDIAFDKTELSSEPGQVTIQFTNPALLEHDVVIEQDGKKLAASPTIAKGETSVTAPLGPGEYRFYCSVPGHAEAGMEGTLTVR